MVESLFSGISGGDRFQPLIQHARQSRSDQCASAVALYVIQADKVALDWQEGYGTDDSGDQPLHPGARFNGFSIRKAYIGLAAALAIHRRQLPSLDAPILSYVEDARFSAVSGQLCIRHLLTHTHGLDEQAGAVVQTFAPGSNWQYNNVGVELLCRLIEVTTGQTVAHTVRESVLSPLCCAETGWETDASRSLVRDVYAPGQPLQLQLGANTGHDRNLYVSASDLARFAWLHLKRGRIDRDEIVPEAVVDMATSCITPPELDGEMPRHGFFWWLNRPASPRSEVGAEVPPGSYQISGMNGSLVLVIPELDAVVVRMTNKIGMPAGYDRFREYHNLTQAVMACLS